MTDIYNPDNWPVEEGIIKSVSLEESGGFSVTGVDSWSFWVSAKEAEGKPVPSPGDPLVVLGGLGHQIRGITLNGVQYRYVSREQAEQERQEWLGNYEREKEESFYANIADWIKRKNELDKPFRERMDRLAKKGFKEFWRENGAYELFTVEQANLLYGHAKAQEGDPVSWLENFHAADWKDQKVLFPDLDEGHSGNTFGGMVWMARAVAIGDTI